MKTYDTSKNRHHKLQTSILKQLSQVGPFIEGSLCKATRPGRKSPSWHLTYKVDGKTKTVYVPVGMVKEVKKWTQEFRRLKHLIRKETKQSLALIHGHVASRRAANLKK